MSFDEERWSLERFLEDRCDVFSSSRFSATAGSTGGGGFGIAFILFYPLLFISRTSLMIKIPWLVDILRRLYYELPKRENLTASIKTLI